jgi:trimeric autotransporter adhesin
MTQHHLWMVCTALVLTNCTDALRLDLPDAGTPEPRHAPNGSDEESSTATSGIEEPGRPEVKPKTCKPGFQLEADVCVDIDECAKDNGGCDDAVVCRNRNGSHACGDCAEGYVGGAGDVCIPILTGLEVSPGTLNEPLSAPIVDYQIALPVWAGVLSLTPSAPEDAQIEIESTSVASGEVWQSQPLPLGETRLKLVVTQAGHPKREYEVDVQRGRGEYERIHGTQGVLQAFGFDLDLSDDTMVVGAPIDFSGSRGIDGAESDPSTNNDFGGARGAAYVYVRENARWSRQAYLKASNPDVDDWFGNSVAVSGDTIVIGAWYEDSGAGGPNANQYDNRVRDSGAVYVFVRRGAAWSQQAYLKASAPAADDHFGSEVDISGDTLVVGSAVDKASVFVRDGDDWSLQAELEGGFNVAIDIDTLATGRSVYSRADDAWSLQGELPTGGKAIFGDTIAVGRCADDEAQVFVRSGNSWSQQAVIESPEANGDRFGCSTVALWGDGLVVGAWGDDSSASGLGPELDDGGASQAGAIYVYQRTGGAWSQRLYAKASDPHRWDYYGQEVAIENDTIAVGALGWGNSTMSSTTAETVADDRTVLGFGAGYVFR